MPVPGATDIYTVPRPEISADGGNTETQAVPVALSCSRRLRYSVVLSSPSLFCASIASTAFCGRVLSVKVGVSRGQWWDHQWSSMCWYRLRVSTFRV